MDSVQGGFHMNVSSSTEGQMSWASVGVPFAPTLTTLPYAPVGLIQARYNNTCCTIPILYWDQMNRVVWTMYPDNPM